MRNQEVRPFRCIQRVFVGLPENRHRKLTDDIFTSFAPIHHAPHQVRVGLHIGVVRPHGPKADAQCLDLLPVGVAGGDDRIMSSGLQAECNGDAGVQVAQRAERRQDDPFLLATWRQ